LHHTTTELSAGTRLGPALRRLNTRAEPQRRIERTAIVYQRGNRRRTILVLVVITAVALITLDVRESGPLSEVRGVARDAMTPVADAADAVFSPVGDWIDGVTRSTALKEENARLRRQLEEARGQGATARAATEENKQLKKLLDLQYVEGNDAIAAQVVEAAPSNFEFTVQIGKGSSDGIGVDMPVVTGAGLVGRVIEPVSRDRATVLLLRDPQSGVGVRIEKSQTSGVVKGRADGGTLRLEFVDPNASVSEGELVSTSGQNSRFPAAIPVGTVSKVTKTQGDLQQDILVKPFADFSRLDYVKVLRVRAG
jgi:rod shape-determining protein MreC